MPSVRTRALLTTRTSGAPGSAQPAETGAALPPVGVPPLLGYLLKQVATRFAQLGSTALAPFGIEGRELAVLSMLQSHGQVSQRELGQALHVDRTTMMSLIDQLEEKGLAQRARNPQDRCLYDVGLTEEGQHITATADAAAARGEVELLADVTPAAPGSSGGCCTHDRQTATTRRVDAANTI
jgi:DNA-binding MarR family transcriptional regulator